jgi:phosphatidate cytidylyltransferase
MSLDVLKISLDYRVIAAMILFITVPQLICQDKEKYNIEDAMYLIGSILIIGLGFNLLIIVRNYDITYLIYLFLITASTDTFAYIGGMLSGRHKLCPNTSPNKTIEGSIIGTFLGTIIASTFYFIFIDDMVNIFNLIAITTFLSFVGQMGDLVCSSIKRYYGKKDFSNIMPGHGGVIDRFNSIIFVLLAFLFFISMI